MCIVICQLCFSICVPLMTSDVEHLFMGLFPICLYLVKSVQIVAHFKTGFLVLLLNCESSLYILDTSPLLDK